MGETMLNSFKYQLLGAQDLYQNNNSLFQRYFHFNLNVHNWSDIWQFLSEQNVFYG